MMEIKYNCDVYQKEALTKFNSAGKEYFLKTDYRENRLKESPYHFTSETHMCAACLIKLISEQLK